MCCCNSDIVGTSVVKRLLTYRGDVRETCDGTVAIGICTWENEVGESAKDKEWCILVLPRMVERKGRVENSSSDSCEFSYIAAPIDKN